MPTLVRLLGRASIRTGERSWEPAADRRSGLMYYLAHAGSWVPRDDLLYLFWPDSEERRGRANLRQMLVAVRALTYGDGLEVERSRVRWLVETDLRAWLAQFARDDHDAFDGAWPGAFLEGFRLPSAPEFESWLELERAAWSERYRSILLAVAERRASAGRAVEVAGLIEHWLSVAPLDEEVLRLWLAACLRSGRRTAALARFTAFEANLARDLGLPPERATVALVERLRSEVSASPEDASLVRRAGQAAVRPPRPRTRGLAFVGREPELARLAAVLLDAEAPLVTLLAIGGMGKTRLALEAAERLGPHFRDGVAVAWLANASALDQVGPALLEALGLEPVPRRSALEQVAEALAERRMLIVLDNVEQLPGVGQVLERLRAAAPGVAWLLTSRERVGLADETLLELGGLAVPADAREPALASYGAVALLVGGARRRGLELDLERQAEAIVRVCRLTAGMPLALALAVGWLRVLSIDRIAAELEAGAGAVLSSAEDDVEPRHVNMEVVFDASWRALTGAERAALSRLAVFRGGFTEAAAREIADVGRPLLLVLRNKSFVSLDAAGRFYQHPLLETFVRSRAAADPEAFALARERHARWFCAYLARWEDAGQQHHHRAAVQALRVEHGNLEAAWAYALEAGWWKALEKGGALFGFSYLAAGRPLRWSELLRAGLERVPCDSPAWAVLEVHESSVAEFAGRHHEAYLRRRRAVATLRRHDDRFSLAWALLLFAESAWSLGYAEEARASLRESADTFAELAEPHLLGMALHKLQAIIDDPAERERAYQLSVENSRQTGNVITRIEADADYGWFVAHTYGEYGPGLALIDGARERLRHERPVRFSEAELVGRAADVRLLAGDVASAEAHAREALALWPPYRVMFPHVEGDLLALLASILWFRGDATEAEAIVSAGSEAASSLRGVLVRSLIARERGNLLVARGCADQALALTTPPRAGRDGHRARALVLVESAEVALALGESATARRDVLGALDLALRWRVLPTLLQACAAAAALVPLDTARAVLTWSAGHRAAPFALRRRLARVEPGPDRVEANRETVWADAKTIAQRLMSGLDDAS